MESRAYTGWELPEAARAQKRVQDFHRKLRNWDQWESEAKREKNLALGGGGRGIGLYPLLFLSSHPGITTPSSPTPCPRL